MLDRLKTATNPKDKVCNVEYQVPFVFNHKGKKIFTYLLDFKVTYGDDSVVFIDVKGFRDGIYKLKKKIIEAEFGIVITEK